MRHSLPPHRALIRDPADFTALYNLGVLASQGDTAEARSDFLHALRLAPHHSQAEANLKQLPL